MTSSYSGTVDNKTMLEAEDDAATVNKVRTGDCQRGTNGIG